MIALIKYLYSQKILFKLNPFTQTKTKDSQLTDLIPFLEDIVLRGVKDVRDEIRKYEGKDLIMKFKKNQEEKRRELNEKSKGTLRSAILQGISSNRSSSLKKNKSLPNNFLNSAPLTHNPQSEQSDSFPKKVGSFWKLI